MIIKDGHRHPHQLLGRIQLQAAKFTTQNFVWNDVAWKGFKCFGSDEPTKLLDRSKLLTQLGTGRWALGRG